jgi:hypothetical protein
VPNNHIRRDLQMTSVKEEIHRYSYQYSTRLTTHQMTKYQPSWRFRATGVCEDTCQTTCLTDFYCNCCSSTGFL